MCVCVCVVTIYLEKPNVFLLKLTAWCNRQKISHHLRTLHYYVAVTLTFPCTTVKTDKTVHMKSIALPWMHALYIFILKRLREYWCGWTNTAEKTQQNSTILFDVAAYVWLPQKFIFNKWMDFDCEYQYSDGMTCLYYVNSIIAF